MTTTPLMARPPAPRPPSQRVACAASFATADSTRAATCAPTCASTRSTSPSCAASATAASVSRPRCATTSGCTRASGPTSARCVRARTRNSRAWGRTRKARGTSRRWTPQKCRPRSPLLPHRWRRSPTSTSCPWCTTSPPWCFDKRRAQTTLHFRGTSGDPGGTDAFKGHNKHLTVIFDFLQCVYCFYFYDILIGNGFFWRSWNVPLFVRHRRRRFIPHLQQPMWKEWSRTRLKSDHTLFWLDRNWNGHFKPAHTACAVMFNCKVVLYAILYMWM